MAKLGNHRLPVVDVVGYGPENRYAIARDAFQAKLFRDT